MKPRKVTLLGGPAAGEIIETTCNRITVPLLNDFAVSMSEAVPPLIRGFVTYQVRRARLGRRVWFVAQPEGCTDPVSPLAIMRARPAPYVFG